MKDGASSATETPTAKTPFSRKEQIVSLSMHLFAEKGFQTVTVREIADQVGILSGSLYRHFSSKQDMLDHGLRPYVEVVRREVSGIVDSDLSSKEKLTALITTSLTRSAEWHSAAAVMYRDWEYLSRLDEFVYLREFIQESQGLWIRTLREAADDGTLAPDVEPEVVWRLLIAILEGVSQRYNPNSRFTLKMTADHLLRMMFGGLASS